MPRTTRRDFLNTTAKLSTAVAGIGLGKFTLFGQQQNSRSVYHEQTPRILERYLAVDNVCAYPSLTRLADDTVVAAIYNQPTHGGPDGDIECWASEDGGRFWKLRGIAARHKPGTSHFQSAVGVAHDGALIVLAHTEKYGQQGLREQGLPIRVCRSSDGGKNWSERSSVSLPASAASLLPFGNVVKGQGRTLAVAAFELRWRDEYKRQLGAKLFGIPPSEGTETACYFLSSQDDGQTWSITSVIGQPFGRSYWYGSTSVARLKSGRWLAAVDKWSHVALFVSKDEGQTWKETGPLTINRHRPGHLLELADGRVLLTYCVRERSHFGHPNDIPDYVEGTLWRRRVRSGSGLEEDELPPRIPMEEEEWFTPYGWDSRLSHGPGCVAVRWSEDEGRSWSWPRLLIHIEEGTDGSYPATTQLSDGTLVTVYHTNRTSGHHRYHMGVIRWELDAQRREAPRGAY